MPCDSGPSYNDIQREREDRDVSARLACVYCRILESKNLPIPEYAENWWKRHKKIDADRKEAKNRSRLKDALRKQALGKLTDEELMALGLEEK